MLVPTLFILSLCAPGAPSIYPAHLVLKDRMIGIQNALNSGNSPQLLPNLIEPAHSNLVQQLNSYYGHRFLVESAAYTNLQTIEGTVRIVYDENHPGYAHRVVIRKNQPAGTWKLAELTYQG
ncbi:unnamed protein product [Caenorhabditis sp. 36 PRJEB53466]|nr:unnamed protein product [Caenorhabditis sp. 36 PRJEB53466]